MRHTIGRRGAVWVLAGALAVDLFGGSVAEARPTKPSYPAVDQPGVTPTEIKVGGVVSKTNPLNGPYASAFDGVQAYFDMVNSQGGVYGRKLKLVAKRDDQVANNLRETQGLLDQDKVFAVLPVATIYSFSGSRPLAEQKVPTFGWEINDEWIPAPNLFGINGYNCSTCVTPRASGVAALAKKKTVGILAYAVPNSADCANTIKKSYEKYGGPKVGYISTSLSFGTTDFSAEVKKMKDAKVDLVNHCLDENAALQLAKEMKKQGLNAIQYLPNAYDQQFVRANAPFFAGSLVHAGFAPFETKPQPTGLKLFNKWMKKARYERNESAITGWMSAYLFVTGLKAAGADFTRQKVTDALNQPKFANDTIQGLQYGSQTINHTKVSDITCDAIVKVAPDGSFVPWNTKPGKPFLCWPDHPATAPKTFTRR
ncbi:MAG: ABC transporter substrate-binding protein [Acidimicrobiia bacterium]